MHELMELVQEACDDLDSSLGDADGLLLHGFVDGHLIFNVHLVELVDAAHTLPGEKASVSIRCTCQDSPLSPTLTLSASIRAPASITNSWDSSSRTTAAVRPAAVLAFPLVYTALGLNSSTCLKHRFRHQDLQNRSTLTGCVCIHLWILAYYVL